MGVVRADQWSAALRKEIFELRFPFYQLAVQHGFGGVHSAAKAEWMVDAVSQWFQENGN